MREYPYHKRSDFFGTLPRMILSTAFLAICHDGNAQNLRRPPVDPDEITQVVPPYIQNQPPHSIGLGNFQANVNTRADTPAPREPEPLPATRPSAKPMQQERMAVSVPAAPTPQKREEISILPNLPAGLKITQPLTDLEPNTPPVRREREIFARSFEEPGVASGLAETPKAKNEATELQLKDTASTNSKKPDAKKLEAEKPRLAAIGTKKEESTLPSKPDSTASATLASKESAKTAADKPEATANPLTKQEGGSNDPDRVVYVVDQDLRQFLTDFSRRFGMRADIAQSVRGRLTKVKLPVDPTALLKELERRFDLEWMIEGDLLKVTARSDLATRIIPLGPLSYEEVIRELKVIDIDTTRYPLRKLSESNSIITTAPTGHIGRIMAMIEALRAGKSIGPDLRIVKFGSSQKVVWD